MYILYVRACYTESCLIAAAQFEQAANSMVEFDPNRLQLRQRSSMYKMMSCFTTWSQIEVHGMQIGHNGITFQAASF